MKKEIVKVLNKFYEEHRLIFWYDEKAEMKDVFESLEIEDVEKIEILNNEFNIKVRVLHYEPDKKFLLYQAKAKPKDEENWLLDLILANKEFRTERSSMILQELGLSQDLNDIVVEHQEYFTNQKRLIKLKELLVKEESKDSLKQKMIAAICNCENDFEKILFNLFAELSESYSIKDELFDGKSEKYSNIEKFKLEKFFWTKVKERYNYQSDNPSIRDFVIELLNHNFYYNLDFRNAKLNNEANILISHWRENNKFDKTFKELSNSIIKELNIDNLINYFSIFDLISKDTFKKIDEKIIKSLLETLTSDNFNNKEIQDLIKERINKFFYSDFEKYYTALSIGANLISSIKQSNFEIDSIEQGIENYTNNYFSIDKWYRQYIKTIEESNDNGIFKDLTSKIEKIYTNSYLLKLNDNWQIEVNKLEDWKFPKFKQQNDFYQNYIKEYENKNNRIFVIISDALRYEIGHELTDLIKNMDRYEAELEFNISNLPSYTQLGMAALLPHKKLSFDNNNDNVIVDGMSSMGKENRIKILQTNYPKSFALSSEDFLKMKSHTDGREFVKPYDIIYIYSNTIDKTGDNKDSENKIFVAVEQEMQYLLKIIKQIANVNGNNVIITSDHGFIYQHNKLDESDFTEFTAKGKIDKINRRFVIGNNLEESLSVKKFSSEQLGLEAGKEVLIPKSINRIRVQGAGSRFVHGGSTLQEIIVPVIKVNKKRYSDISKVEVDLLISNNKITSNRVSQSFYQRELVSEKTLKRTLRIAFYSKTNDLVSDVFLLDFNNTNADDLTKEIKHIFTLSNEISKLNDKEITLKLEEPDEGSNYYKLYKEYKFNLALSFYNEFDD